MKKRILAVGGAMLGITLSAREARQYGGAALCDGAVYAPSGRGADDAVALARLGMDTVLCSCVGDDMPGRLLLETYARERLDTRFVSAVKGEKTALKVKISSRFGEERLLLYPGAMARLGRESIENAFMAYPDALLLDTDVGARLTGELLALAKGRGIPVFVDAGRLDKAFARLEGTSELVCVGEEGIADMTGIAPSGQDECLRACMRLFAMMAAKYVVLRLGERGSFVYDGSYCEFIPSLPSVEREVEWAEGAFCAALTFEYIRSGDALRACKYAGAARALAKEGSGPPPAMPYKEEIDKFLGWR